MAHTTHHGSPNLLSFYREYSETDGALMLSNKVHAQLLKNHHLFAPMSQRDLESLIAGCTMVNLEKNQVLFWQGDEAGHFYLVLEGLIKLYRIPPDGTEKIIEIVRQDQSFAEAVMFLKQNTYPLNAQALEHSRLLSISNSDYLRLVEKNSELAFMLLGRMSQRLHHRLDEIETLSIKNAALRVVRYLLKLAYESGLDQPEFEFPTTKRLIASQLSIQPATLSRIFHKLNEEDIIHLDGRHVTILDTRRLREYELDTGID